jgi:tetratricopeptide (TPR) repeat protein
MKKPRKEWALLAGIFGASYAALWTFLEASASFGLNPLKDSGIFGHIVLLLFAANITLIVALFRGILPLSRRPARSPRMHYSGEELSRTLVTQFREMLTCEDYQTILRLGVPLSRALWLEGQYHTRVEVGRVVEEAANRLHDYEAQAQALMDDIGWTSVALGQLDEAEKYIARGIDVANDNELNYLSAKGYRHLAGIEIQKKAPTEALSWLDMAHQAANAISSADKKREMLAGIEYGRAEALLHRDELNDALAASEGALNMFLEGDDNSRAVKVYAQIGKIRERKRQLLEARDSYREGLRLAEEVDRADEIIRNHLGLARVALGQGDKKQATHHLDIAKEMQKETPLVFELDSVEEQIKEVERRERNARTN